MLYVYLILVLICAISSSHGGKHNDQGQMSVRRNAADFLNKMLQVYNGDSKNNNQNNPQNQQSKEDIRNKPLLQMPGEDSNKKEKGQRSHKYPWYSWYSWYDDYKKHKHGHDHKHHKKHHHHELDLDYYYSSYEDDYKKHIIIPGNSYGENKKHIVIPKDSNDGNKKHIVIPNDSNDGNKKHIVIPKNGYNGNKKHMVFPGLASIFGKQNERIKISGYNNQADNQWSGDSKKWKPPQYGSEENKKVNNQGYGHTEDKPNAQGFLRELWNMYKAYKEMDRTDLF